MSGGTACHCAPPDRSKWVVLQRECNRSAFNGYVKTRSEWSEIFCTSCRSIWRTKARYVAHLHDAPEDWYRNG